MKNALQQKKFSEITMVDLLRKKDQRAISLVYKNYSAVLYGVIHKIVKSERVAQEVLQDCFVKIWSKADQYNPEKGRFFTWMINIARNAAIDKVRSVPFQRNQQTESIDVLKTQKPMGFSYIVMEDSGLKKTIASLDEKHRILIDLVYFQGYSQREIEKQLTIPLGTIKSRIKIAIRELRLKLNPEQQLLLISA